MKINLKNSKYFLVQFLLLLISSSLFFLQQPNFIKIEGFSFLAWFIYLPPLFLIRRANCKTVWLWGGFYGIISLLCLAYWLKSYDSNCLYFLLVIYFFIYALFFLLLKFCDLHFKKNFWLLQWLLICAFEFLKTKGFLGFNYGITAYSQWNNTLLIQICDIVGVFGLNLLIIFTSSFVYGLLVMHVEGILNVKKSLCIFFTWAFFLSFALIYGKIIQKDYSTYPQVKVAAIQNNEDPFEKGLLAARNNIQMLIDLTNEALDLSSDIDIVLWPETAVLPAIQYHYENNHDNTRHKLVSSLMQYINYQNQVFVLGNGHIQTDDDNQKIATYNSALVFYPGKNVIPPKPEIYSKIHLVPYSEYFPYKEKLPFIYNLIVKNEDSFWDVGKEYKTFSLDKNNLKGSKGKSSFYFSVPICFEDTFTDTGRKMYKNGSRAFLNISNDAWSKSEVCQYLHMSMAVFRSVENRVPSVRSTSSGQTCAIDPNGKITNMAASFCETFIISSIPIIEKDRDMTIYCKIGDLCAYLPLFLTIVFLLSKMIIVIIGLINKKKELKKADI